MAEKQRSKWMRAIFIIASLTIFSFLIATTISLFISSESIATGNVVIIPIKGLILTEGSSSLLGNEIASSSSIIKLIEKADKNPDVKAIIFEINTPGGSAVASDEIAARIKKINKTTASYIREVGASGGYWIASATDRIFINRMSVTGSIGVIASYLEFSGLLDDYNITYNRLVAGDMKDVGSPFKKMTIVERDLFQEQLDVIHDYFIEEIAENRGLPKKDVKEMATGMFYLGVKAKELGLVDEIGGKQETIDYIEKKLNITADVSVLGEEKSFIQLLSGALNEQSFFIGKGIGSELVNQKASAKLEILT